MTCTITQGFGENSNGSYSRDGLNGHPAIDRVCGYKKPILPEKRIYVYKILDGYNYTANDGSGFTGVFGIDEEGHEWLYGHCDVVAGTGKWYETTDVIGYESNHGEVYSGGVRITKAMQDAGDSRGHHTHIQKRECELVEDLTKKPLYTYNWLPLKMNGKFVQVRDYENGYNGCVDWTKDAQRKVLKQLVEAATQVIELLKLRIQRETKN